MGQDGTTGTMPPEDEKSLELITAVAEERGVDPLDLEERLHEVVDTDALWQLFGERPNGVDRPAGEVTFRLARCEVTVRGVDDFEVVGPGGPESPASD